MWLSSIRIREKYLNLPKAAKAALWFTCCSFFLKGLGFITGPIYTRLLPPEEYGVVTLYATYEQIIIILATWEIHVGAFQRGLFKFDSDRDQYTRSTLLLINTLTIIFFAFIALFNKPVEDFTQMSSLTLSLLFVYLLIHPAYLCWITRRRTQYDYKSVVLLTIMSSVLSTLVTIVAILYAGRTAQVRFNTGLIFSILFNLYFYITTFNQKGTFFNWKVIKPQWSFMITYEAPLILHSLSYLVLGQADRVMIGKMVGTKEAAFYGVAYTLASVVTILQASINEALVPWRYQKLQEKNYKKVGATTNMLLILFGTAILFVVLIAPEIMMLLFTDNYYEAVWSIPPISVSIFFMFLYSSFVAVESYYEQTKYIMYVSVFCGMVNIVLNYLLIPIFGYIVCGYTTLLSYILFAVLHYVFMRIVCSRVIPGVKIFSVSSIVTIAIMMVVVSTIISMLYPYWIVRYSIVLGLLGLAFVYREKIKGVVAIIKRK